MDTTIIYYTDHSLADPLFTFCQEHLKKVAWGSFSIVSVSHYPIDLGINIVIGTRKRSWLLLYKQILKGVEAADTKYVAMAEHDCLYPEEHFQFIPPKDDTFYYNENSKFVQWAEKNHPELKGMYSTWPKSRLALSSLICNRKLLLDTLNDRLNLLDKDRKLVREIVFAGEFGLSKLRLSEDKKIMKRVAKLQGLAESGRPTYLKQYLKQQLDKEKYDTWSSSVPYLDIRHDGNFTGPRRGKQRTYEIPYWGKFKNLMDSV
jgi:hypothetical protein